MKHRVHPHPGSDLPRFFPFLLLLIAAASVSPARAEPLAEAPRVVAALEQGRAAEMGKGCLLYTSPSPRDRTRSRMPSSA